MKIALLADASHTNIQRWCEGLQNNGVDLHLLSFTPQNSMVQQTYPLPLPGLPGKVNYFTAVLYVKRLLREIQPDILMSYYVTGYGTLGTLTGFHPLVMITAGSDVLIAPRSPLMRRILRSTLKRGDLVAAFAPHMAQAVRQLGVPDEKIFTLPQGIFAEPFIAHRSPQPKTGDPLKIISTRSLRPIYNLDLLIRATSYLAQSGVPFEITIASKGGLENELKSLAQSLDVAQYITFAGFVPNHELPELLALHNTYLSLTPSDGVSASLLEAMAVGLVPLVVDHPANRYWITPGENGILLDMLTPEAAARALLNVSTNLALRQRAWTHNVKIVTERGDMQRNIARYVKRISELIAR
ncbi:MAG: glycosyltransferase family 4 protein [Chloroflexota bacterium]